MMAIKTVMSTVIRKYEIFCNYKNVEEIDLQADMKLKAADGNKIWLRPRKQ